VRPTHGHDVVRSMRSRAIRTAGGPMSKQCIGPRFHHAFPARFDRHSISATRLQRDRSVAPRQGQPGPHCRFVLARFVANARNSGRPLAVASASPGSSPGSFFARTRCENRSANVSVSFTPGSAWVRRSTKRVSSADRVSPRRATANESRRADGTGGRGGGSGTGVWGRPRGPTRRSCCVNRWTALRTGL
jgi:hypothetical protein